ncbi:Tubby C-terminal-like domain [Phytophthora cactorum]|nr:Tubby C-terminal-like domain [Phytophthora cactorum]
MADEKGSDESKDGASTCYVNPQGAPGGDPTTKKKALPPPSNPPPKAGGSAAAAFRSKSSLPPPNGPPPGAGAPSASVAKIRGAARPPSGGPPAQAKAGPPTGAPAKPMGPPSSAPSTMAPPAKPHPTGAPPSSAPPKAQAKPVSTPRAPSDESKADSKPAPSGPPKPKPDAKRSPPTSARGPPEAKTTPRSAPVDILGKDSPVVAEPPTKAPPSKPPKPVTQTQRPPATAPVKAPPTDKPPAVKPPLVLKSTMEVLNDATAALSARSRASEEETELSASSGKEKENSGVFTTKMGMAAQFSGQARLNEIPFLEDGKPDAKAKQEKEEKPVEHEDDPEIVIESKRGPPNPSASRSSSSQDEARSEHKDNEEKEDSEAVSRRNATHEDIYDELRKMKRGSGSPRNDEHIGSEHEEREHERDGSRSSSFDRKDKISSNSDESMKEQSSRENRDRDRDRDHDRDRDRDRENHVKNARRSVAASRTSPRKSKLRYGCLEVDDGDSVLTSLCMQFFNPKSVPYIPDHMLEFVKRPLECGRGQIVKCFIERNDSGPNKLAPIYTLLLEVNSSSGRPIMYARKMATSRITSHYVISMNKFYIGKLRSSTSMMEYSLYDQGDNPEDLDSDCEVDEEVRQSIRAELAVIRRATCVSVKNFQLVHSEPTNEEMREQYRKAYPDFVYDDQGTVSLPQEYVLLQLGKVGKDCFNMDFHVLAWSDKVPERNGEKFVVQDLAFRPDGTQVVAAVGTRVLVYDAVDGTLLHSLKGHKGTVYSVDYSHDGKRFASGGADNIVIIWTDKAEGILKYTHNDSIQKLAYNPQSQCLASCTSSDFGLWAPEQKSVAKHKVVAKILSACWSKDGQLLALGLLNGNVTLRDKLGTEKRLIERSSAPVWALAWSPALEDDSTDILAVGCWDRTLAFYSPSGVMQGKARKLGFNPTSLTICEQESWVWAIKARPKTNFVGVGSEDGTLAVYCLVFGTVHGIYQERYAYREHLTDVIVQHLMTEQKVRIKTRDCVKKLSVYRDRLAVQLSDRIIIYELAGNNATNASYDMHYRVKERITKDLPCSLLVVTSLHFILCQKQKLQQYDFTGRKEREWVLESLIRYIKVTGGAPGREGLLVGLKDGSVWQIFINNPFPIPLIQQSSPISCLDISANREKLAVVDDSHKCLVYDLATKQLLFEEGATNSVAWNTECEDMLCFGGNGQLKIRAGQFPGHTQRMQGFVVGFSGSKVFSLSALSVQTIDVPQSAPLLALVGVGGSQEHAFSVARKAFIRVRDVRYIELVNALEQTWKQQLPQSEGSNQEGEDVGGEAGKKVKALLQAEIMAHQGKFPLAAKLFADCGEPARAIKMFADLRMWDEAKRFATARQAGDVQQLVLAQARWAEDVQDWRAAAEMYAAAGTTFVLERSWGTWMAGSALGAHTQA